jgi:hypothetical protein
MQRMEVKYKTWYTETNTIQVNLPFECYFSVQGGFASASVAKSFVPRV